MAAKDQPDSTETDKAPVVNNEQAMKDAYNRGVTISDIANEYNLTPLEVAKIVVVDAPVEEGEHLQTQAEIDAQENGAKA